MKILFITSSSINGGAQKHIREMFKSLTSIGHDVYLSAPRGWLIDELKGYGCKIMPFKKNMQSVKLLLYAFESIKPDVTNTFILSGGILGTFIWKRKKYGKLFITVNNPVIYDGISIMGKLLYPFLYRWMSKWAFAFLVKSDMVRDEVFSTILGRKPVISIKNGIDFNVFDKAQRYIDLRSSLGIHDNEIVISNVAVLNERKGQLHLIEAISKLSEKYVVHLLIVGEGPFRNCLETAINQLKLKNRVHLLGRRSDINAILYNTDIFVLSSHHEGLPNALMEAMAMGKPCISTDVGGVSQLIKHSENGLIIPPRSTDAIVNAIEFYLQNKDIMKEYASKAYVYMNENFKQDIVARELCDIYINS